MSTGARAGTHVLAIDHESTAFNTAEADYASAKLRMPVWDVNVAGLKHQAIENQAVRVDLGEHPPAIGVAHTESEHGFTTYTQGLGTAAGDATAATATAFTRALASVLGGTPALSTGSTASDTPSASTTTTVNEADADNHADDTLVGFALDNGDICVRPVGTYTSGATGVMDLLMALPSAPTAGNVIYGGANVQSAESSLFVAQGEYTGKNTAQNYKWFGSVGNFSLPETAEGEPQTISFTYKTGNFTRYDSLTQVAPSILRPLVAAGGEYLIAKFGETATTCLSLLRIGIDTARTYAADPDACADTGISGWVLTDQQTRITVHVRDTASMPSGFSVSNYFSSFGSATATENDYHLLLNFGQKTAGRIFSLYFPRIHLVMEPEPVEIDGIAAQKLTFGLTQGQYDSASAQDDTSGVAKIWAAQH